MKRKLTDEAIARLMLGDRSNRTVEIIAGYQAPTWEGCEYHWTTPSGVICRYPSAYRRAYGRPIYHASTLHITVGRGWLARHRGLRRYDDGIIQGWTPTRARENVHGLRVRTVYGWDRNHMVVSVRGRADYHVEVKPQLGPTAKGAARFAIAAWRQQDAELRAIGDASRVWCGVEHARAAGYCDAGIQGWCAEHGISADAWHRGDLLLQHAAGDARIARVVALGRRAA